MDQKAIFRIVLNGVLCFVAIIAVTYVKQVFIDHATFNPNWTTAAILTAAAILGSVIGENRRQENEKEKEKELQDK